METLQHFDELLSRSVFYRNTSTRSLASLPEVNTEHTLCISLKVLLPKHFWISSACWRLKAYTRDACIIYGFDKDHHTLNWRHARPREFAMQKKCMHVLGIECLETPTPLSAASFQYLSHFKSPGEIKALECLYIRSALTWNGRIWTPSTFSKIWLNLFC